MSYREFDLIHPLSPAESLCLRCPLPDCDESDPRCPYQNALGVREDRRTFMREYQRRRRAAIRARRTAHDRGRAPAPRRPS